MSKQILIIVFMMLTATSVFSQVNKSIFFEVGNNGIGFSANFDSRFSKSEKGLGYRVGISFVPGIGYRYASPGKGITGRIFFSPLIGSGGVVCRDGVSMGYKF